MPELILLRNSERSTYRRCRWRWKQIYGRRIEPNHRAKALTFGTMVHVALAEWYVPGRKRGTHPAEAFLEIYDEDAEKHGGKGFDQWDEEGNKVDARELGWAMLTGYVERYGKDDHLEILQPEMTFAIDVHDKKGRYLVTLVGTIDGPARNLSTGRIQLLEHKTAKIVPLNIRINSDWGEQGLTYWWAANMWLRHLGVIEEEELIDEVLFNVLRKAFPDERPCNAKGHYLNKPTKAALQAACQDNGLGTTGTTEVLRNRLEAAGVDVDQLGEVSKSQPRPLFLRQAMPLGESELENFGRRLRMEAYEMAKVRAGELPIYKSPSRECDWCPLVDACEINEIGGDWESVLDLEFHPWEPYEAHELMEEHFGSN